MIIIDEHAEIKMIQHLEKMRGEATGYMSLALNLSALPRSSGIAEMSRLAEMIGATDGMIFCFENGQFFLISPNLPPREVRKKIFEFSVKAGADATEIINNFQDLQASWPQLYTAARQSLKVITDAQDNAARRLQDFQEALVKDEIVHVPVSKQLVETIATRRRQHTRPVVLLVEDEAFSSRLVEGVLAGSYDVTCVDNGQSAILAYSRLAPDIMFLDIDLPDISGHDVLRRVQELDAEFFVVMLSGNADRQHIGQAISGGAKGFVGKPFTRDKLRQYIESAPSVKNMRQGEKL